MTSEDDRRRRKDDDEDDDDDEWVMAQPPDGGWGWVVVFCSFMVHVIADGVTYTFGIFYTELLRYFGESKGATSWVASIMVGTTFCIGPLASGLTNQFGCRTITIAGSLLASFGLIVSTFAPSISFLYFSIGLCTGAGFGLMYLPAIVCVTCYFEKRRAFATGIAVCGSGIGTFLMAPLTELMVDRLGWQGAMLVVAGLVLNCCVFGALFRPLQKRKAPRRKEFQLGSFDSAGVPVVVVECNGKGAEGLRKGSLPNGAIGRDGEVSFTPIKLDDLQRHSRSLLGIDRHHHGHHQHHPDSLHMDHQIQNSTSMTLSCASSQRSTSRRRRSGPMSRKDSLYSGSLCQLPEYASNPHMYSSSMLSPRTASPAPAPPGGATYRLLPPAMREALQEMTDFRLMRDPIFLMFGLSNFFTNIGFNVPFVYTKDRALGLGIADEDYASYLLSVIGIANTLGRVVLGYLSDKSFINRLWLYNASLTLCGFATAFSSLCNSYQLMALYAVVFGATAGAYVSLTSVILVDLLGLDKLTNAFGLLLLFEGVACLIGPPITGWLYDYMGSYDPGFTVSGAMIALSGLMLFFIPCVQRTLKSRTTHQVTLSQVESQEVQQQPSPEAN